MTAVEILKALLDEYYLGDHIYHVREVCFDHEPAGWEGNAWDHPYVKRYAELIDEAKKCVRQS